MVSDILEGLQSLMNRIKYYSKQYGLNMNAQKTKHMIISKEIISGAHLFINRTKIEIVNQYNYLGTIINEQWDNTQEIKFCVEKARIVFNKMSAIF